MDFGQLGKGGPAGLLSSCFSGRQRAREMVAMVALSARSGSAKPYAEAANEVLESSSLVLPALL